MFSVVDEKLGQRYWLYEPEVVHKRVEAVEFARVDEVHSQLNELRELRLDLFVADVRGGS